MVKYLIVELTHLTHNWKGTRPTHATTNPTRIWFQFHKFVLLSILNSTLGSGSSFYPEVDYMTLGKWALLPAADDVLEGLVEMGRADALRWGAVVHVESSFDPRA